MATRPLKWRTRYTSGYTYVDSEFGSNVFGNGSMQKPYATLSKKTDANIICRGYFSENVNKNGFNSGKSINGDYYGAAVFDGNLTGTVYGWWLNNMIIKNDLSLVASDLGGVGATTYSASNYVGYAQFVGGVCGSRVLVHNSCLYMGTIGGHSRCKHIVYSKIVPASGAYLVGLGNGNYSPSIDQCTIYGIPIENRRKSIYGNPFVINSLFGKTGMIANDTTKFTDCIFAADCKWYWFPSAGYTPAAEELVITGETSAEREASLKAAMAAKGTSAVTFTRCIFSTKTSDELMNNPEHLDFTLRPTSEAIRTLVTSNGCLYLGAMPPAIALPIMDDSTGVAGTWDERSIDGCFEVVNNNICVNYQEIENGGRMMSKIVKLNPSEVQVDGLFSLPTLPYKRLDMKLTSLTSLLDFTNAVSAGNTLPIGWYRVRGNVTYNGTVFNNSAVIYVTAANTTFSDNAENSVLIPVVEPNTMDTLYCRCRQTVYARVGVADDLQTGGVYLNDGEYPITYRSRTIAVGESFVAMNTTDKFTCSDDSSQTIAVMFDDTRVPSAEWIPAQTFGEYFVSKKSGAIEHDDYGVPLASGNYLAHIPSADGGYSDRLKKNIINQVYVQFALFAKYYGQTTSSQNIGE